VLRSYGQPRRGRTEVGRAPFLVSLELTLTGDRCCETTIWVAKLDNERTMPRIQP